VRNCAALPYFRQHKTLNALHFNARLRGLSVSWATAAVGARIWNVLPQTNELRPASLRPLATPSNGLYSRVGASGNRVRLRERNVAKRVLIALLAWVVAAPAAFALTISGMAEATDTDVLRLEGYQVFLLGVESIEAGQTCEIRGQLWECYPAALRAMQTIAAEGPITCEVISGPNIIRQVIAVCTSNGEDIGRRLVRSGFGLTIPAETMAYEEAQAAAQAEGIGLWQGQFLAPALWRQANGIFADRPAFRPVAPAP
jgi:endonuclease YncB( thermonuclease family)